MFGIRFCVVEILRMDCRCSSVRRLLCDVLLIFITENSFSHRYVLPNIHKVRAAWTRSWGIASGMKQVNCAGPTVSYFAFSVPLHCSFHVNSKWVAKQLEITFLCFKVTKAPCELSAKCGLFYCPWTDRFPRPAQKLLRTFPWLSHRTSVWQGMSPNSESISCIKDWNWRWFKPLALIKFTFCVCNICL